MLAASPQGNAMAKLTISGKTVDLDVELDTPLSRR
jgi:hypothetical protein